MFREKNRRKSLVWRRQEREKLTGKWVRMWKEILRRERGGGRKENPKEEEGKGRQGGE